MTVKVILVLMAFNVLVTEAASASGTHGEANGCIDNSASGGGEQIQSCSFKPHSKAKKAKALLQAQVRTRSAGGGQTSQSFSGNLSRGDREQEENSFERVQGTFTVTVVKASVEGRDWFGASDPFVAVRFGRIRWKYGRWSKKTFKQWGKLCKSPIVWNNDNPVWNHECIFHNPPAFRESLEKVKPVLHIAVFDVDRGASPDFLGEPSFDCWDTSKNGCEDCSIPCKELVELFQKGGERTYDLDLWNQASYFTDDKVVGKIAVKLKFKPDN